MTKPLSYLASPYWHENEEVRRQRGINANLCAAFLTEQAREYNLSYVFSPIAYTLSLKETHHLDHWQNSDYIIMDLDFLAVCGELIVLCLHGWLESKGVALEIAFAEEQGTPVKYMEPDNYQFIERPDR